MRLGVETETRGPAPVGLVALAAWNGHKQGRWGDLGGKSGAGPGRPQCGSCLTPVAAHGVPPCTVGCGTPPGVISIRVETHFMVLKTCSLIILRIFLF